MGIRGFVNHEECKVLMSSANVALLSIYNEIGPGERIALSRLGVQTFERTGRPLRIAIDISIWLFQIQSGKGMCATTALPLYV